MLENKDPLSQLCFSLPSQFSKQLWMRGTRAPMPQPSVSHTAFSEVPGERKVAHWPALQMGAAVHNTLCPCINPPVSAVLTWGLQCSSIQLKTHAESS